MKLNLVDAMPEKVKPKDIVINGERLGSVSLFINEYLKGPYYHSSIKLRGGLIQGFGPTEEEAVSDAIKKGRLNAYTLLADIDRFEEQIS